MKPKVGDVVVFVHPHAGDQHGKEFKVIRVDEKSFTIDDPDGTTLYHSNLVENGGRDFKMK